MPKNGRKFKIWLETNAYLTGFYPAKIFTILKFHNRPYSSYHMLPTSSSSCYTHSALQHQRLHQDFSSYHIQKCLKDVKIIHLSSKKSQIVNVMFTKPSYFSAYHGWILCVLFVYFNTMKYPFCGHILGGITHKTALDWHWGGYETLKWVIIYVSWFHLF